MSQVLTPKLSTVDQPSFNGIEAFNLLLEEMNCHKEGEPFSPRTIELETNIIKNL
jgi:LacI family transcriptional regulator